MIERTVDETAQVRSDDKEGCYLPLGDLHILLVTIVDNDTHRGFEDGKRRVNAKHEQVDEQEANPVFASLQLAKNDWPSSC